MVGIVLVVLFGALSVVDLPIQLTPDIATPTISVSTVWPGAAPVEIETEILEPQEEVLKNVQGLTRMESSASMNSGSITLEFEVDTVIEEALVRVTNKLSQVASYPDSVREPVVETANSAGPPLAVVAIRDPKKGSVAAYRTWVEDEILPEIDRIPGVAGIFFIGGQDTEVHVLFDAQALAARGLSVQSVADRVRSELRDLSGGDVTLGKRRYLVRTAIAPETPAALEEVVLGASSDGTPILLGDVATVKLALRKPTGVALVQDRPAMVMLLSREAGTNVLEVTREVHEVIARLQREKFDREGLQIEILADQVEYIEGALDLVQPTCSSARSSRSSSSSCSFERSAPRRSSVSPSRSARSRRPWGCKPSAVRSTWSPSPASPSPSAWSSTIRSSPSKASTPGGRARPIRSSLPIAAFARSGAR